MPSHSMMWQRLIGVNAEAPEAHVQENDSNNCYGPFPESGLLKRENVTPGRGGLALELITDFLRRSFVRWSEQKAWPFQRGRPGLVGSGE